MQNYKQGDTRWAGYPYCNGTMAAQGCGACATANIIGRVPTEISDWLTSHGYASNQSGTYWGGIPAVLSAYGYNGIQLNYDDLRWNPNSSVVNKWKTAMASGKYYGVLLMGKGVFTNGGHYITIVKSDGDRFYVHDPAYAPRDGWHPWADFAGCVKVFYLADKKDGYTVSNPTPEVSSNWKATGTATCTDNDVNVRSTASDANNGNILGQLNKGNRFEVDGIVSDGWVHVKVGGIGTGYVYKEYVKYDGETPKPSQPTVAPSPIPTNPTSYSFKCKQITIGDTGLEVLLLQEILKARGIYKGSLDRSFGNQTYEAVRKYQQLRNFTVDGVCGTITWNDLLAI